MSDKVHVLSLGYSTELLSDDKSTSDGATRRRYFAQHVESYTLLSLTRSDEGCVEVQEGNLTAIPTGGKNFLHSLWLMYRAGCRVCKEGAVTVIQTQEATTTGLVGYLLKLRFNLPLSVCVFGPNPWDKNWVRSSIFNRVISPLAKLILKQSQCVIADGTLTLERLLAAGLNGDKLVWKVNVPSNIDQFSAVSNTRYAAPLNVSRSAPVILCVGNMSLQKNVPFILAAFREVLSRVPDARMTFIGRGKRKREYVKLSVELGLDGKIDWLERVPHDEMPRYYAASTLVIVGSRFEGFPRIYLEAASAARPVVTTEVSGCTDGIRDGHTGYVVPQGDQGSFVRRTVELLQDEAKTETMGLNGRLLVESLIKKRDYFNQLQINVWKALSHGESTQSLSYLSRQF